MTVYVDDMYLYPMGRLGRLKMSHMIASDEDELHAMAERIGVARKHWQPPTRSSGSHYDICMSMRGLAINAGAIPVTIRQLVTMNARRRVTGELGDPTTAEDWYREHFAARRAGRAVAPGPLPKGQRSLFD
ncbi:DUF4031 domain-containing protein [Burkholderia ambifaria]|uniref:DUF4031 domain-containing protein n=1 Tax=Burkholderia ambifaria TaxID=152480 RepID=UPI000F80EDB0|nr:DUF4031 domain-containing protein [Burkholderia ambifaria]